MTETKHSQEIHAGLPKKKWFRLEEVADRWSELTGQAVTVDDVLHYEEIGELRIAAHFCKRNVLCTLRKKYPDIEPSAERFIEEKYPESISIRRELKENLQRGVIASTLSYPLSIHGVAKQLISGDEVSFEYLNCAEHELYTADFTYHVIGELGKDELGRDPPYKVTVHRDDLRITRAELERFEQKHGLGKPAPMPIINEDTELKRAYRALGALAMQFAKEKTKLMNGEKPNASQIAKYALNAVSDSEGHALYGYGDTVLRDVITTALNTVNKDLSNR